jgi:hypothetical protein
MRREGSGEKRDCAARKRGYGWEEYNMNEGREPSSMEQEHVAVCRVIRKVIVPGARVGSQRTSRGRSRRLRL